MNNDKLIIEKLKELVSQYKTALEYPFVKDGRNWKTITSVLESELTSLGSLSEKPRELTDEEIEQEIKDIIKIYDEFTPLHELEILSKRMGVSVTEYCRISIAQEVRQWIRDQLSPKAK